MASNAYFSPGALMRVDGLNSLETWIEVICHQNNISNSYFGNILVATSELFHLLVALDPDSPPSVYCSKRKGAFVIGFETFNNFLDVAALVQKDPFTFGQQIKMNYLESCIVSIKTCADWVQIESQRRAIELFFYIKSINSYQTYLRQKCVGDYIEGICAPKIIN